MNKASITRFSSPDTDYTDKNNSGNNGGNGNDDDEFIDPTA